MTTVQTICDFLQTFAPVHLAEDWDNVGLLVGDRTGKVQKIMTCLTVTPASAAEAQQEGADIIVAHHPLPFRPLKRLTTDNTSGRLLLELIRSGVAIYSPHTAFDSAAAGINQQLAEGLGLSRIEPLTASEQEKTGLEVTELGAGRFGQLAKPVALAEFIQRVKVFLKVDGLHLVGDSSRNISRVAVACGSAGQFLPTAIEKGCELLLTGETSFHTCLEAEAMGVSLLLPGHYASERFAVETLATVLAEKFPKLTIWASRRESDPLDWV